MVGDRPGAVYILSSDACGNRNKILSGSEFGTDTTLRLNSPGTATLFDSTLNGTKRKRDAINKVEGSAHHSLLFLGLGPSPSSSDNSKGSSLTVSSMSSAKEIDEGSSIDLDLNFDLHLDNENMAGITDFAAAPNGTGLQFDLQLSLLTGTTNSGMTSLSPISKQCQNSLEASAEISPLPTAEEGSVSSAQLKFGNCLLQSSGTTWRTSMFAPDLNAPATVETVPAIPEENPVACASEIALRQQRNTNTKNCQFLGCGKGARGASGLCIAHGGGRRCQKIGCHKGAEGKTIYCKAHGGGRRCQFLGCTKSAEGRTDYCISHGGGRRCSHESCTKAARGKSGLCIRHGGGKRCQKENCTKSAEGYSGLCISHGGGRRCQFPECTKGAQGSTKFCKAHGGGKRCTFPGCDKGAEGSTQFCKGHGGGRRCSFEGGGVCPKSVHGGTQFCVAHGGGKRCTAPECTKSARGRTEFCVRHGGGKRCKSDGCGKSAQGSTDFCKAHGGGRRCSWGQAGSIFEIGGAPCERFARGKTGLCAAHSALVQDQCVHGGGSMEMAPPCAELLTTVKPEKPKDALLMNHADGFSGLNNSEEKMLVMPSPITLQTTMASLPEGRVHGGSMMAKLFGCATVQALWM